MTLRIGPLQPVPAGGHRRPRASLPVDRTSSRGAARWVEAVLGGALAGLLAGAVEAFALQEKGLGAGEALGIAQFVAASGLLVVPLGVVAAIGLYAVGGVVPSRWRSAVDRGISAHSIYAVGVAAPLVLAVSFRIFLVVSAGFRNPTLAALGSALLTLALFGVALAVGWAVAGATRVASDRNPTFAGRRFALAAVAALWAALALPGLIAGPDRALLGPFGFVGLLRKDTLDYTPLLVGFVLCLGLASIRQVGRLPQPVQLATGGLLAIGLGWGLALASSDAVRPLVLEHGIMTRASLRAMQRAGDWDGDGFSRWLGGGDCDDSDPRRNPAAREIPGNGVDEDCDGEDLDLQNLSPREKRNRVVPKLPDQLSFLFITVDALRPDLGFMGYDRDVSPRIDQLARRSVVYDRTYSISTYTGFCLPPLMASRYPSEMPRTDRHEVQYLGTNVMVAERLRDVGFHTAGAASHFLFTPELGWVDGFERFLKGPLDGDAPAGSHVDLFHSSRGLADGVISLLEDRDITSGRFFIWVHFLDPHKQYLSHQTFSKFGDRPRDLYDGEIAFTDHHIGRVLDALDASPLGARTVVILTGDHGEAFGEHGAFFHGAEVWDEIVRVPLIVRVPGAKPRHITRRVSHVDLAPTVADLAGLPADPNARGESLVAEIFGANLDEQPILIDQPKNPYYRPKRAYIEGGLKLHHLIDANTYRLYDLEHDPAESKDLARSDPAKLKRIQHAYRLFTSRIADVDPVPVGEAAAGE